MGSGLLRQIYDIYFGVDPEPAALKADQKLGPWTTARRDEEDAVAPGRCSPARRITGHRHEDDGGPYLEGADLELYDEGDTTATAAAASRRDDAVIWAKDVPGSSVVGLWTFIGDPTAAGGYALWNTDKGKSKISTALASPSISRGDVRTRMAGVPYHMWVRLARSQLAQYDSVTPSQRFGRRFGSATNRIGTAAGAEFVLQGCTSGSISGWAGPTMDSATSA